MSIRAVILDRDGVLVSIDRLRLVKDLGGLVPFPEREIGRRWAEHNRGVAASDAVNESIVMQEFLSKLARAEGVDPSQQHAIESFDYTKYVLPYPDAIPALKLLRERGFRVGLLTNNSMGLSPTGMLESVGMSGYFDAALSSQLIGAAKPDSRAYHTIAVALEVQPHECIYVDNVPAWADGARTIGMHAFTLDRTRSSHALDLAIIKDLSAVQDILAAKTD